METPKDGDKKNASAMHLPVILTPQDVDRLLQDSSESSRLNVLEKVSTHYNQGRFAPREHEIAEQIFRLLMKDAVIQVRENLAQAVKHNQSMPRDIILHLAKDVEQVALPVLAESSVLSDADLEEIVMNSQSLPKLMTISQREGLASRVSEALVDTQYAEIIESLLSNESAEIAPRAFEKIVDSFRNDASVMQAVASRKVLPITVVDLLVQKASDSVADALRKKYRLENAAAKHENIRVREEVFLRMLHPDISEGELHALVAQMARDERLTPSIMLSALCRGHVGFFVAAITRLSGVPPQNVKRLLSDRGDLGFYGIYDKADLPPAMKEATRIMLRAAQMLATSPDMPLQGSLLYANRLIETALMLAGDQTIEYLPYCLALVRQQVGA